jgi:phosphoribosylglycinamide formyltransferase-1
MPRPISTSTPEAAAMRERLPARTLRRMSVPLRLGFLASHGGSNLQAILDAIREGRLNAQARIVISNNSASLALERARTAGIPALHLSSQTHAEPAALDRAIAQELLRHGAELVVLAGYMRKIGPAVLAAYPRRIVNIHPALLPNHGGRGMFGIHVHEAVLAARETETGATVHLVDAEYDRGPALAQARVPVAPGDTTETLQQRVLAAEHRLYAETLQRIATGEIDLDTAA